MESRISCRRLLVCSILILAILSLALSASFYFLLFFQPNNGGISFMPLGSRGSNSMDATDDSYFDVRAVCDGFTSSLLDNDDIGMKEYVESYKHLSKFFAYLGKIFSFIASEVESKIGVLEEFLNGSDADNFTSVKKMINYEMENNLFEKKDYVSGSRTLLRLHRGLDFIRKFLQKVSEANNTDSLSSLGQEAYSDSLANYHPWLVRKGANVAMYALPTREVLLHKLYGDNETVIQQAIEVFPKMLSAANEVYRRTDEVYTVNKLHDLP